MPSDPWQAGADRRAGHRDPRQPLLLRARARGRVPAVQGEKASPHPKMSAQVSQKGKCISGPAPLQQRPHGMQNAISLLRVSTKKQINEGDGIENQRRGNNEYTRRKGYRLLDEIVIAETADAKKRKDFGAALDA